MSFISDVRNRRQQQVYTKQNDIIFNDYLKNNLGRDDLKGVLDMIEHPEVYTPLLNHADALLRQEQLDDELRKEFADSLAKLPQSKIRDDVIQKFSVPDNSLASNLNVVGVSEHESFASRIKKRIGDTYASISERLDARTDKMKAPFINARDKAINAYQGVGAKVKDSSRNAYNNAAPVMDMIKDRAKNQLSRVRDEYRSRKLTYQNDANFAKALAGGVSVEALNEGLNNFEYPEIRYALMNNADKMFKQASMTPEIATNMYLAAEPYLTDGESLSSKFVTAFNNYADSIEMAGDTVETSVETKPVEPKPLDTKPVEPKPVDTKPVDAKPVDTKPVDTKPVDTKTAVLTGFDADGVSKWEASGQPLTEDDLFDNLVAQYDAEMSQQNIAPPPSMSDDSYFANLSANFDTEISDEKALMAQGQGEPFLDDLNTQVGSLTR